VADSDQTMTFRAESRREDPAAKRAFEQPLPPPGARLGLEWKDEITPESGAVVARVTPGMPAAQAGLKPGDRILRFAGAELTSDFPLRLAVLAAKSPLELEVASAGETEPRKVQVQLRGGPTRLGIAWRDDAAEPGTVLVTQVVPGSAAYLAGLKERDRIYEIGGRPFATSSEFRQQATTLPGPVELLVERSGRLFRLSLEPFDLPAE
jgi:S1-C subfamily serine protease